LCILLHFGSIEDIPFSSKYNQRTYDMIALPRQMVVAPFQRQWFWHWRDQCIFGRVSQMCTEL